MYKMIIVDDEKEIREGLSSWSWEEIGIEMAGCCAHGLEALQFVTENPVDIVVTDIRMPFMNGTELMENLNRLHPYITVVILSGHSDFEYAETAIRNGAADYLLKPVKFESLARSFGQLIKKLDTQKQAEYRTRILQRKAELLTLVLRDNFLRRLFQSPMCPEDIEQAGSEGEVMLRSESFTVAVFRLDRLSLQKQSVTEREMKLLTFSLDNILHDLWDSEKGYHFVDKSTGEFYLLSQKHDPHYDFAAILPLLEKYIGLFKSTFSAGIGQTVALPAEIHLSAQSAVHVLNRNPSESSVSLYSEDVFPIEQRRPPTASIYQLPMCKREDEGDNAILVRAKQYITVHYRRSITLKEVADHVFVSQGHLSALFKETGETYLKFLTAIRIKKAMELIMEARFKVYEVVEMVGYSDPAYFSELFKKYTGKSPNEFRGRSKQLRED
jgi:two-component system response regulator YesN